jgi:pimeloyl-ACP methyl ester carboxylesterase
MRILAVALVASLASGPALAAKIAATVEYEPTQAPPMPPGQPGGGGNAPQMQAGAGANLSYLDIKAIDGFHVISALWKPDHKAAADTTIIISVHGSGNSFRSTTGRAIGHDLSMKGYAILAINTRQSGRDHVNRDNFYDISLDIDAAVQTAKAMGYRTIVLHGQSLGNIQVQYYAATHWDPAIKGVVISGTFGNLPWKTHNLLVQDEANYRALRKAAHEALLAGVPGQDMPIKMMYFHTPATVSAQHFLTYRDDLSAGADGTFWIRRIPRPILILRSESDKTVEQFEPYQLLSAAHAEGSLVPEISFQLIPDPEHVHTEQNGHEFPYNSALYTAAIGDWLAAHKL